MLPDNFIDEAQAVLSVSL